MFVLRVRHAAGYATLRAGLVTVAWVSGCEHAATHERTRSPIQRRSRVLEGNRWRADTVFAHLGCSPPGDTDAAPRSSDTALVAPGVYALELVATTGSQRGGAAAGHLVLNEAHRGDRSLRTGQVAYDWPTDSTYLYGATDLAFRAVAAPMDEPCRVGAAPSECGGPLVPPPNSEDPVFPGVRGSRGALPPPRVGRPTTLLIGTLGNARVHELSLDGAGIGLTTTRVDSAGFGGWWRPWGVVEDGAGYFCAFRVQ